MNSWGSGKGLKLVHDCRLRVYTPQTFNYYVRTTLKYQKRSVMKKHARLYKFVYIEWPSLTLLISLIMYSV